MLTSAHRRIALTTLTAVLSLLTTAAASSAALPRTYQVQRVDSPNPTGSGRFGLSLVNVGDINGDGKADILTGTDKHGVVLGQGQVAVINGADGSVLRTYALPDVDNGDDTNAGNPIDGRPSGFGNAVTNLGDIGACTDNPAPAPGTPCTNISAVADGIPEEAVGASGVDLNVGTGAPDPSADNSLGVIYVFDGGTGALLKRLVMPAADRTEETTAPFATASRTTDPRFGRTLLSPGDVIDAAGAVGSDEKSDLIVGATDFSEVKADANPESQCATQAGSATCVGAGRVYVYSGNDVVSGTGADIITPAQTIKSPMSQPDDNGAYPPGPFNAPEGFGILLIPIGAAGSCQGGLPVDLAGTCGTVSNATATATPTPDPAANDFAIVANGFDVIGMNEVGRVIEIDGRTLSNIKGTDYPDPNPEASWGQAQNGTVYPAAGDLGKSTNPDFVVPDIQWSGDYQGQGRALVINGQPTSRGSFAETFARFMDPTPQAGEQFGLSLAGVGDVGGADSHGELLIGAIGPHNPAPNPKVVNDVHFFDPITGDALQSIGAPDAQGGESFGVSIAPLGDVNGDGFVDFASGAGFYNLTAGACQPCTGAGRVYIFRSDNSPAPPAPGATGPQGATGATGATGPQGAVGQAAPAAVIAGRSIELVASPARVRSGSRVRLRGAIDSFTADASCERGVDVELQRRSARTFRYRTFGHVRSDTSGEFSRRVRVKSTTFFRALVRQTSACIGTASTRERVTVVAKKASRGARRG